MVDNGVQIPDQSSESSSRIHGIAGLTSGELERELASGGRFVFYEYCISFIALTLRRPSDVYFLRAGNRGLVQGLPYSFVSLLLGWWGIPWGFIYTPLALATNFTGGCDITAQMRALLHQQADPPSSRDDK